MNKNNNKKNPTILPTSVIIHANNAEIKGHAYIYFF